MQFPFIKKKNKKDEKNVKMPDTLEDTYLKTLVPLKGVSTKEDYITIEDDGSVSTILYIYDKFGKTRELPPQWGLMFISDLVRDSQGNDESEYAAGSIRISFLTSISRMPTSWTNRAQKDADAYIGNSAVGESRKAQAEAQPRFEDLNEIAEELASDSSYLAVSLKYLITAKTLKDLNLFLVDLKRRLDIRIPGLILTLSNNAILSQYNRLFANPVEDDSPKRLMFTSDEFAGFYNLVTTGIEDPKGSLVGEQIADINNSAVIWDACQFFDHHAVIASGNRFKRMRDFHRGIVPKPYRSWNGADMWFNTVLIQLMRDSSDPEGQTNHIFTLALDPIAMTKTVSRITTTVDLSKGLINPFEMFGSVEDELEIYAANIEKWKIMARQMAQKAYKLANTEDELSNTVLSALSDVLKNFYINQGLWVKNAKDNREDIRIVGVPHKEYPTLNLFNSYLESAYQHYQRVDKVKAQDINTLKALFNQLEVTNGDLFNVKTDNVFDQIGINRHTLFDYSKLSERQGNVLLIQLLNSISAIASKMEEGDVLIIHGAERITDITQRYVTSVLNQLYKKQVRVIFTYNSIGDMLENADFSHLSESDWSLFGFMTRDQIKEYSDLLGNNYKIPGTIADTITVKSDTRYYLHRGIDNVIFDADPVLDPDNENAWWR